MDNFSVRFVQLWIYLSPFSVDVQCCNVECIVQPGINCPRLHFFSTVDRLVARRDDIRLDIPFDFEFGCDAYDLEIVHDSKWIIHENFHFKMDKILILIVIIMGMKGSPIFLCLPSDTLIIDDQFVARSMNQSLITHYTETVFLSYMPIYSAKQKVCVFFCIYQWLTN